MGETPPPPTLPFAKPLSMMMLLPNSKKTRNNRYKMINQKLLILFYPGLMASGLVKISSLQNDKNGAFESNRNKHLVPIVHFIMSLFPRRIKISRKCELRSFHIRIKMFAKWRRLWLSQLAQHGTHRQCAK